MFRRQACIAVLFALVLAAPVPSALAASGLAIAWNHCFGDAGATQNAVFACDTNAGAHEFHGSFQLANAMSIVIGWEASVEVTAASPALPAWWSFKGAADCRQNSLSAMLMPAPGDGCVDWSQGQQQGGIGGYCSSTSLCADPSRPANFARILMVAAVAQEAAQELIGAQDYFAFAVRVDHAKSVGAGACGGCEIPVCLRFSSVDIVARGNVETRTLTNGMAPGAESISWQAGGNLAGGPAGCLGATPVRRSSWSSVKSLYR